MGHDTVEGLPATVAHSRRTVGARRVPADYRPPTRLCPGRSGARHQGFALATGIIVLAVFGGIVKGDPGGGLPPVVVDSIEPTEIVQGQVPQPTLQVFGSNFIEGMPSETNRPTVTLRHVDDLAEFSALAWVNFAGTVATLPADLINLLQAPLGVYDVIVTRPTDDASDTLEGAFTVTDGQPDPGEIALVVRSAWGGPVNDVEIVGDLAYAAIGRRLVVLDVSDATNPVEVGSLKIMPGVQGVAVRDGYAFLGANKPYRFCVADVSDPTNPVLVSAGAGADFAHDVELYGDLAYVRETNGGFIAIDITDPQNVQSFTVEGIPQGEVGEFVIIGDLMYLGTDDIDGSGPIGAELRIYDLAADPLNPPLLGLVDSEIFFNGETTAGLAVEGSLAAWTIRVSFIDGSTTWFLHVVDISDLAAPVIVGTHNDGSDSFLGPVALSGGLAYVADFATIFTGGPAGWVNTKGLAVFDIATDPTNPTLVGTFKTHGNVRGVEIIGNRAYLYDEGEGLIILDVSDPANLARLGNYHSPSTLREMTKVGDLLYVTDAWNGFTVLDVSNATHPEVVSAYVAEHFNDRGVNAWGITVQDDLAYLGAGYLGLDVVDVSDPATPTFLEAFRIPSPADPWSTFAGVAVSGDIAHVGFNERPFCGNSGIDWFLNLDVSDPQGIVELGRVQVGCGAAPLTIELNDQSIAFIGREHNQVIVDTSDAANPILIFDGSEIGHAIDVALAGNLLYAASEDDSGSPGPTDGLWIQDVTDPANPVVLAHVDENTPLPDGVELNQAYAVATQNQRLYVVGRGSFPGAGGISATYVFDVSDPTTPDLLAVAPWVGGVSFGLSATSVLVDEPYQYVANASPNAGTFIARSGLIILELVGLNPVGDLDGDGSVGASDLLILLVNWGTCADCNDCPPDLNGDCSVGAADLLILLVNWG